jgi:hypothetical protein
MMGYWDDVDMTAQAIDQGHWMHTGDLATIDEEGYVNIVGRIKDMVIRGGENVYPREIEEFLYTHPAIADVQVIGVPDVRYGEELCALVRLHAGHSLTLDELRVFCRDRIAHYKIPRYLKVSEEFPMTVTGKVQKFRMRADLHPSWACTLSAPHGGRLRSPKWSVNAGELHGEILRRVDSHAPERTTAGRFRCVPGGARRLLKGGRPIRPCEGWPLV